MICACALVSVGCGGTSSSSENVASSTGGAGSVGRSAGGSDGLDAGATGSGGVPQTGCVISEQKFTTVPDAVDGYDGSPLSLATALSGTWQDSNGDTLDIQIRLADGGTYHESTGISVRGSAGQPCSAATYFGIGAHVGLKSTDERFAEQFDAALRLLGSDALLTASIPIAALKGAYHPTDAPGAALSLNGTYGFGSESWFLGGQVVGEGPPSGSGSGGGSGTVSGGSVVIFPQFDTRVSQ